MKDANDSNIFMFRMMQSQKLHDYTLNLSISLRVGKENNNDFLSRGD